MTLLKSANDSKRDVINQWMYTHTHTLTLATNTERFAITFWKGKIHQRFKLQQIVKKKPKRYSSLNFFKETIKKRSTLAQTHVDLMAVNKPSQS